MTIDLCDGLTDEEITIVREYIKSNGKIVNIHPQFNVYIPFDLKIFHLLDKLKIYSYHYNTIDKTNEPPTESAFPKFNSIFLSLLQQLRLNSFDTNEKFIELVKQNTLPF